MSHDELKKAKMDVCRLLKYRLRSEQELRDKLITKNISESTINETITYFKDLDCINDRLFCRQWITSRLKKPFGFNRIQFELKNKGIPKNIIDEEFQKLTLDYSEINTVVELAQRRILKYKNVEPEKQKQRLFGFLARRGYNSSTIMKALKEI